METKLCSKCHVTKPTTEFRLHSDKRNLRSYCLECDRTHLRDWKKNNKDKVKQYETKYQETRGKERTILNKYGLTKKEHSNLLSMGCEVCGTFKELCVDHNHDTGEVRGCLCRSCNVALGRLRDDPTTIMRLAEYARLR